MKKILYIISLLNICVSLCNSNVSTIKSDNKKFVIIVASYNNKYWYQRNLDSIFMQDYENYKIIYIDDNSPDKTGELVENYIKNKKQESKFQIIKNTERAGCPLANQYKAIWMCNPDDIIVCLDGDDSFAHEKVLSYLNNIYQDPNIWVTYGQFCAYPKNEIGWAAQVSANIINHNRFRETDWVTTHLKTFYASLFHKIKKDDLLFNGDFFPMAGDLAFMFPILEMAGKHSKFIPDILYIYNMANPINEDKVNRLYQIRLCTIIRERPKYSAISSLFNNDITSSLNNDSKKKIYIKAGEKGILFDIYNPIANRDDCLQANYELQKTFEKIGYEVKQTETLNNLQDAYRIVSLDIHPDEIQYLNQYTKDKLILFLVEPPTVSSLNYDKKNHEYFSKIYTWLDDLVDNKKYFKYYYPVMNPMIEDTIEFENKKLCTMIACNKISSFENELYSERLRVIQFFENLNISDFDFYGLWWNFNTFKNYKGPITRKNDYLKNYKFSFCFENTKNIKGYVTEKIFDCFRAGCVPIYWGACNIEDYVPKKCFILKEDFEDYEDLYKFIKNMTKEKYLNYINNIKDFLKSEKAKLFSSQNYIKTFKDLCDIN